MTSKTVSISIPKLGQSIDFSVGKNANGNFAILDNAKYNDIWFHIEGQSSCHVIASVPDNIDRKDLRYIIKQGAVLCKQHSRHASQKNIAVIYARAEDVKKTDTMGTVLASNTKTVVI